MYLAFLNLGPTEIVLILIVAVLLFGGKLPRVARDAGRWFFQVKRGMADLNRDLYDATTYQPPATPPRQSLPLPGSPEEVTPKGDINEPTLDAEYDDDDYSEELGGRRPADNTSENADYYSDGDPYGPHDDDGEPHPAEESAEGAEPASETDPDEEINKD